MMELVDIADLKSVGISRASSSLAGPIKINKTKQNSLCLTSTESQVVTVGMIANPTV